MGNISELSCPQIQKKAKQNTSICWKRTTFSLKKKFFFLIYAHHEACGILVPQPGVEPMPPAVEAWSLSHWTTREVPGVLLSISKIKFSVYFLTIWISSSHPVFWNFMEVCLIDGVLLSSLSFIYCAGHQRYLSIWRLVLSRSGKFSCVTSVIYLI